jgi:hypothetical protein
VTVRVGKPADVAESTSREGHPCPTTRQCAIIAVAGQTGDPTHHTEACNRARVLAVTPKKRPPGFGSKNKKGEWRRATHEAGWPLPG